MLKPSWPLFPLAIVATFTLSGCTTPQPIPIGEVISYSRTGNTPDRVISRLRASRTSYALRGSDFPKLAQHGVPTLVLDELQQSFVNSVDMLTRFSALGESYGGSDWCYPQPLNLANLDRGGNGMTGEKNLGRAKNFARPVGVPAWVPASPGNPFAQPITADDVATWASSGISADEVAQKVRQARYTQFIIGSAGIPFSISTHYSAGLKGSQLAALSQQGVPTEALDALQEQFLAEYIEFARHRYQNFGKGQIR